MHFIRLAPGYYQTTDGRFEIDHIVVPDEGNGYGRTDHWVVTENAYGYPWDPYPTLREAKAAVRRREEHDTNL